MFNIGSNKEPLKKKSQQKKPKKIFYGIQMSSQPLKAPSQEIPPFKRLKMNLLQRQQSIVSASPPHIENTEEKKVSITPISKTAQKLLMHIEEFQIQPFKISSFANISEIQEPSQDSKFSSNIIGNLNHLVNKNKWNCSVCLSENEQSAEKCPCCDNSNPTKKPEVTKVDSTKIIGSLSHLVHKNKWNCSVCLSENEQSAEKCPCCDNSNPTKKPEVTKVDSTKIIGSLSHLVNKNKWNCSVCLSENEQSAEKCPCCDNPNPIASLTKSEAIGFTFSLQFPDNGPTFYQEEINQLKQNFIFGQEAWAIWE